MKTIATLLEDVKRDGWTVLRDFPSLNRDEFLAYVRSAGPCLEWGFGPVMDLKVEQEAKNYLFTCEGVPFHWDGVFFEIPSVLVFQCLQAPAPGSGGETLFCHAEKLYAAIPAEKRRVWASAQVTYTTEKVAHYGGSVTIPLFGTHPHKGTPVVRFAERVTSNKNPVDIKISGVDNAVAHEIEAYFVRHLYDDRFCYVHEWRVVVGK